MAEQIHFPREMGEEDALFWNIEAEPLLRATTSALTLLDSAPDRDVVRARMQQAAVDIPRLRQHVVTLPSFVSHPVWVRDPYFDLDYHLRWIRAPGTGRLESLLELAAAQAMASFDRSRPLWEFTIVEGLEDGRAAVIQKLHHAVTDGVGGMLLMERVYDRDPERPLPSASDRQLPEEREPGTLGLIAEAMWRRVAERPGIARARARRVLGLARHPIESTRRAISDAIELGPTLVPALTPKSPIARARSSRYRYHAFTVDLENLRQAARSQGCTINDAFVTGLAGGLARYHALHGARVDELRATVPVNLRRGERESVSGNRVAMARVLVPLEPNPRKRMLEIQARLKREYARPNELMMQTMARLANRTPESLRRPMMRTFSRGIDFVASCVPGFDVPLYMAGARVSGFHMFGPTAGTAVNATLFSYEETASIALNVDPAAIPDTDVLRRCVVEGFDEVLKLA